jgi:hypothetical protein
MELSRECSIPLCFAASRKTVARLCPKFVQNLSNGKVPLRAVSDYVRQSRDQQSQDRQSRDRHNRVPTRVPGLKRAFKLATHTTGISHAIVFTSSPDVQFKMGIVRKSQAILVSFETCLQLGDVHDMEFISWLAHIREYPCQSPLTVLRQVCCHHNLTHHRFSPHL